MMNDEQPAWMIRGELTTDTDEEIVLISDDGMGYNCSCINIYR